MSKLVIRDRVQMPSFILVRAEWDPEASVWVATSEDVPGLVTEAESMERLREKVRVMIPELLDADVAELPVHFVAHAEERLTLIES